MLPSGCFSIAHVGVVTKGKRFHPKNPGVFRDSFGPSFTKFQLNKKKPAPPPKKKSGLRLTAGERTAWFLYYFCLTLRDLAA